MANAIEGAAPRPCNQHVQSPTVLLQERTSELCQTDFHGLMPEFSHDRLETQLTPPQKSCLKTGGAV